MIKTVPMSWTHEIQRRRARFNQSNHCSFPRNFYLMFSIVTATPLFIYFFFLWSFRRSIFNLLILSVLSPCLPTKMGLTTTNSILVACFCIMLGLTLDRPFGKAAASVSPWKEMVRVGVIMEQNSTMGEKALSHIHMAWSDFYDEHASYRTRLSLHFRDPQNDVVAAASAGIYTACMDFMPIYAPSVSDIVTGIDIVSSISPN